MKWGVSLTRPVLVVSFFDRLRAVLRREFLLHAPSVLLVLVGSFSNPPHGLLVNMMLNVHRYHKAY